MRAHEYPHADAHTNPHLDANVHGNAHQDADSNTNPHLDANVHANVAGRAALRDAAGYFECPGASIAHGHTDVMGYANTNPDSDMVARPYLDAHPNANVSLSWRPL